MLCSVVQRYQHFREPRRPELKIKQLYQIISTVCFLRSVAMNLKTQYPLPYYLAGNTNYMK